MDNKSIIVLFGMLVAIFIVSFTLSIDAVAGQNVTYGIYAFVGFLLVVFVSLFENMILSSFLLVPGKRSGRPDRAGMVLHPPGNPVRLVVNLRAARSRLGGGP